MKTPSVKSRLVFTSAVVAGLALLPTLQAQTTTADQNQSSKSTDSTADQHSASTGAPGEGAAASSSDKTSSRDTTSLDNNPSTAPTDSANKSATKDPTGTTEHDPAAREASDKETANSDEAGATATTEETHRANRPEKLSDNEFLIKAAQGGMTEVELGKLAEEKAASADVKQFGSRMVADHSQADSQLKSVADKKGVTIPAQLDARHQAMVDHFSSLSGPAFDRAYVHAMVRDHERDVSEFRQVSTSAQDPDVKNFAGSTLPTLESHLADIKRIQGEIK